MNGTQQKVKQFMELFGQEINDSPTIVNKELALFRVRLIQEEAQELEDAILTEDLVEIGDALADLQYVLDGAIHTFGFEKVFPEMFEEVQRSNMSKACMSELEAEETIEKYKKGNIEVYSFPHNGKWLIKRKSDDKVLKSINYSPANLKPLINE
jgi:predicted HAD superfamily Cof-like phosphohydrolase